MKGGFLKHFLIIGGGTLISLLLGVFTTPIITRLVSPSMYGQYSVFTLYANLAVMVLYLGLDQALIRYFYDDQTVGYRRRLLYRCVRMPVMVTVECGLVVSFLQLTGILRFELGTIALLLLCVYVLLLIGYRFALLMVRLQYNSKLYSMAGIVQKVSYIAVVIPLILAGTFNDLIVLIWGLLISCLVSTGLCLYAERKYWRFSGAISRKPLDHVSDHQLLRYALPYVLSMGVATLFQSTDKFVLNVFGTYADVGVYASTLTLINVFSVVQTSFNALWAPLAVEHYSKDPSDRKVYRQANQIITVVMFTLGFGLILCRDVFAYLLGAQYRDAAYVLPFLVFNPMMYTISETTVNGLVFLKKSRLQVVVALVAFGANLIGNLVLDPIWGPRGAAISTGLSYIVFFTMRTWLSNRLFYVDFGLKRFYLITAVAVGNAAYATFHGFDLWSVMGFCIGIVCLISLYRSVVKMMIKYSGTWVREHLINRVSSKSA